MIRVYTIQEISGFGGKSFEIPLFRSVTLHIQLKNAQNIADKIVVEIGVLVQDSINRIGITSVNSVDSLNKP